VKYAAGVDSLDGSETRECGRPQIYLADLEEWKNKICVLNLVTFYYGSIQRRRPW
jgi:hypothetical protein